MTTLKSLWGDPVSVKLNKKARQMLGPKRPALWGEMLPAKQSKKRKSSNGGKRRKK
jgi:hypothetical protein